MDDVEAEAALLALGNKFRWTRQKHPYVKEVIFCHIGRLLDSEEKLYIIEEPCHSNFNFYAVLHQARIHTYEAVNDAKAACERHHATGKWD